MTTAIYVRVSTKQQDQRSQLADLERWAKQLDEQPLWFNDSMSGKTMDRPAMNVLLDECRAGNIKRIVVWRLDRLGRTARGLLELCHELNSLGVTLVSLREGIDLSTPNGRLMITILAGCAEFELEVKSERQRAGIEAIKARNGGKCPWGGSKKGPRKATAERVQKALELSQGGLTLKQAAIALGMSERTLRAAKSSLQN